MEPWRLRFAVRGDNLPYESDACYPAVRMLEMRIIINSVISEAKKEAIFLS